MEARYQLRVKDLSDYLHTKMISDIFARNIVQNCYKLQRTRNDFKETSYKRDKRFYESRGGS